MENYTEIRHLGRGAFGEVTLARRNTDGRLCAVKQIRRSEVSTGELSEHVAEVRALQSLNHPCVLKYYGSVENDNFLLLVMEYADSGDLQQLIRARSESDRTLEVLVLLALFAQVVAAVAHVHIHKVLHRDLKPSNVLLTSSGVVKLGDFGVAKVLAGTVCDQMTCVGSPTYMAPEIVGGEPYGAPCDVWSLGVILYELCMFRKPFEGRSIGELVLRVTSGLYEPISERPGQAGLKSTVEPLITKTLVVEPKERAVINDLVWSSSLIMFMSSLKTCAACVAAELQSGEERSNPDAADLAGCSQALTGGGEGHKRSKICEVNCASGQQQPAHKSRGHTLLSEKASCGDAQHRMRTTDTATINSNASKTFALSATSCLDGASDGEPGSDTQISFSVTPRGSQNFATQCASRTQALQDCVGMGAGQWLESAARNDDIEHDITQLGSGSLRNVDSFDQDALRNVLGNLLISNNKPEEHDLFKGGTLPSGATLEKDENLEESPGDTLSSSEFRARMITSTNRSVSNSVYSPQASWSPVLDSKQLAPAQMQHSCELPPLSGAVRNGGSMNQQTAASLARAGQALVYAGQSTPSSSESAGPSTDAMELSATWPIETPRPRRSPVGKSSPNTLPTGRAATPNSDRRRRLEWEQQQALRGSAFVVSFTDSPEDFRKQREPPRAFIERYQAHDARQKSRDGQKRANLETSGSQGSTGGVHISVASLCGGGGPRASRRRATLPGSSAHGDQPASANKQLAAVRSAPALQTQASVADAVPKGFLTPVQSSQPGRKSRNPIKTRSSSNGPVRRA